MKITNEERRVVECYFKAMQAGKAAEPELMALFADDAVLTEPFHGEPKTHRGTEAIRKSFHCIWEDPVPDVKLEVNRIDLDGDSLRAEWTCTAPAFSSPIRGHDFFKIRDGKIVQLDVIVTEMPEMAADEEG